MSVVIEAHLTSIPAYILVRSDKYASVYKLVEAKDLLQSDAALKLKRKVDSAFNQVTTMVAEMDELSDLYPEHVEPEVEVESDDTAVGESDS